MKNIQDTGLRGYLKWLRNDQPGIYVRVAPMLAARAPEAFSDREQSSAMGSLMGLADDVPGVTTFFGDSSSASADVADAANTGTASPSITGMLSNLVAAAGQIYMAKSQVDTLKQINDIQLQRAQAGLPPLPTSSLQLGIPQVNLGVSPQLMTSGSLMLLAAAGFGVLMLLGKGKRSAR